jgi:hypothetical protein
VRLAPVTPVTDIPEDFASVATNASNSSLTETVENEGDVRLEPELDRLVETITSVAIAHHAGIVETRRRKMPRNPAIAHRRALRPEHGESIMDFIFLFIFYSLRGR